MGAPKQKWTEEEEQALKAGVSKHGAGKWRTIQRDPQFNCVLKSRSNIDLKDKWRNMSLSCGIGSREKVKTPKSKGSSLSSSPRSQKPARITPPKSAGVVTSSSEPAKASQDGANPPRYGIMIMEAITGLRQPDGVEISAICKYIEDKHEVPTNFRRLLSSKLRRLIGQNKIEKVNKLYRIKDPSSHPTKAPTPKLMEPSSCPRTPQSPTMPPTLLNPLEDAASSVAYTVADAEAKSHILAMAVTEYERITKMAEQTESLLMLVEEINEKCSRGERVVIRQAV